MPELNDEDHLAHSAWNVLAIIHMEEMIKRHHVPEEMDDLPRYEEYKVDDEKIARLEEALHPFKIELHADGQTVRVSHDSSGHSVTKFESPVQRYNYFSALRELKKILDHTEKKVDEMEGLSWDAPGVEPPHNTRQVKEEDFNFGDEKDEIKYGDDY